MTAMPADASGRSEWRTGWRFVALTVVALTCSPTTLPVYTMGIFMPELQEAFGWGRGPIQTVFLFSTGLGLIGGPLAGWMVNRFGVRTTIMSGLIGLALAVSGCAAMTGQIWQLYVLYASMAILGAGAGAVTWTFLIAERFEKNRGLALGIALSGTGVASMVMPWVATIGVELSDWRSGYLGVAAFCLLVILPLCAIVLRNYRPSQHAVKSDAEGSEGSAEGQESLTVSEAIRSVRFWLLGGSTLCIYVALGGLVPNIVPAMTDTGMSIEAASTIMTLFGISIIVGRITVGALVDRLWAPAVAATVLVPAAIACFALQLPLSFGVYAVLAIFIGLATGMEFDMLGFLAARYFGLANFARIYGRLFMFLAAGSGVAPLAYGFAYDTTGSYQWPFTIAAGLLVLGAIGLLAMGRYPKR